MDRQTYSLRLGVLYFVINTVLLWKWQEIIFAKSFTTLAPVVNIISVRLRYGEKCVKLARMKEQKKYFAFLKH